MSVECLFKHHNYVHPCKTIKARTDKRTCLQLKRHKKIMNEKRHLRIKN